MSPVTHCQPLLQPQMPPSILKQSINYQPSPQPILQEKPPLPPLQQAQAQTQETSKGKESNDNTNKNAT